MNLVKFILVVLLAFAFNVKAESVDSIIDAKDGSAESVEILQKDFEELKNIGAIPPNAKLFVKKINDIGMVFKSKFVVVAERLASMDRDVRLFVLAHEGTHARHKDEEAMEATSFMSNGKASVLKEVSHSHEMRADKEAAAFLKLLGIDAKVAAAKVLVSKGESATHPAPAVRIAAL